MAVTEEAKPKEEAKKEVGKGKDNKKKPDVEELSEEDLALKANLDLLVERVGDADPGESCVRGSSGNCNLEQMARASVSCLGELKAAMEHNRGVEPGLLCAGGHWVLQVFRR